MTNLVKAALASAMCVAVASATNGHGTHSHVQSRMRSGAVYDWYRPELFDENLYQLNRDIGKFAPRYSLSRGGFEMSRNGGAYQYPEYKPPPQTSHMKHNLGSGSSRCSAANEPTAEDWSKALADPKTHGTKGYQQLCPEKAQPCWAPFPGNKNGMCHEPLGNCQGNENNWNSPLYRPNVCRAGQQFYK